jgi:putative DNA primase/helicase
MEDIIKYFIEETKPVKASTNLIEFIKKECRIFDTDNLEEVFDKITSFVAYISFRLPNYKISSIKKPRDVISRYYYVLKMLQLWLYYNDSDLHKEGINYYAYYDGFYHKISLDKLIFIIYEVFHHFGDLKKNDTSLITKLTEFNLEGSILYLSKDYTYFNLNNAIIGISNEGEIIKIKQDRRYFFKYKIPVNFDDKTTEFKYLNKILDNLNPNDLISIQTFLASCLIPNIKTEKCLYIFGKGGTGKSTFAEAIRALFTNELVSSISLENISKDQNMIFSMRDKILNISNETSLKAIDFELFKTIISKEKRQFRKLYSMPEEISEYPRQMIISNNYPNIDSEGAIARRLVIVEFSKSPEKLDLNLLNRIIENDLPALFTWILKGIPVLLENGIITSESTDKIIDDIKSLSSIGVFLEDYGYKIFENNNVYKYNDFYKLYVEFCRNNNLKPDNNKIFSRKLENVYNFKKFRYGKEGNIFISLKEINNNTSNNNVDISEE